MIASNKGGGTLTRIERSIEIKSPPEKVWPLLLWERCAEYNPSIKSVKSTSEKKRGVGATAHVLGKGDGQKFEYDIEVTEYVENDKCAWRTTSGDWTALGSNILKPTEAGTELTMMIDYQLPYSLLGKIIDKLRVRKSIERNIETALENIKSIVEK